MHSTDLHTLLIQSYDDFFEAVDRLPEDRFSFSANEKWSAARQLDHLYLSVRPVWLGFLLPPLVLRLLFGKANRPSRTYDELVKKYQKKLADGGKAPRPFLPKGIPFDSKTAFIRSFRQMVAHLARQADKRSKHLDQLVLPHPLLGKITLREMILFTAYHARHHLKQLV